MTAQSLRNAVDRPLDLALRLLGRAISAGGAVVLLGGLELTWIVVRGPDGEEIAQDALEHYHGLDMALVALACLALAGLALPPLRRGAALRVAAGLAALGLVGSAFLSYDVRPGAHYAAFGAACVALGGAYDLIAADPVRWDALDAWLEPRLRTLGRLARRSAVLAVPLAVMTWPVYTLAPGGGTDGSGPGGLHAAAWLGIPFGDDFVFTYGPLGFLTFARLYYVPLGALALLYVSVMHWALIAALIAVLRRVWGVVPAVVIAYLAGAAFANTTPDDPTSTELTAVAFIAVIVALRTPPRGRALDLAVAGAGVLGGFAALVKPNTGVTVIALGAVAALAVAPARRLRCAVLYGGALVLSFLVFWLLAGESPGAIPGYVLHASDILSGYGEAGAHEEAGRGWEYLAAALVIAGGGATAVWATRGWARAPRAGALLAFALFAFGWYKGGFVHHDGHSLHFFTAMAAAALAFSVVPRARILGLATAVAALAAFTVAGLGTNLFAVGDLIRPGISRHDFQDDVQTVALHGSAYIARARADLRRSYGFDGPTLRLVRGHTVHFEPQEASAAWAYPELHWRPLPVFQTPFAFDHRLDLLNADFLASARAPERILRSDEGLEPFEAPTAFFQMYCRYDELRAAPQQPASRYAWQTLGRGPSRCGAPRPLGSVATRTGATVAVPRARARGDELVFVRIHGLELSLGDKLRKALDKVRHQRFVTVDDDTPRLLVSDKATSPLVLAVPARFDWSRPFTASLDARRLRVDVDRAPPGRPVRFDFFAVPLSRPAA